MNEESLKILKERLPRGYSFLVKPHLPKSKRHISKGYIAMVLSGTRSDMVVVEALLNLAEATEKVNMEKMESLTDRISRMPIDRLRITELSNGEGAE